MLRNPGTGGQNLAKFCRSATINLGTVQRMIPQCFQSLDRREHMARFCRYTLGHLPALGLPKTGIARRCPTQKIPVDTHYQDKTRREWPEYCRPPVPN